MYRTHDVDGLRVTAYPARHTPETQPTILRVECGARVVTYTGDTDWTEDLVLAAENADLLVCECYFYDKPVKMHMNYATLRQHLPRLRAKSVVLTHMSPEMLRRVPEIPERCAEDGLVVPL
jgi:ribonuclease BN (tRNA processing enzyme)